MPQWYYCSFCICLHPLAADSRPEHHKWQCLKESLCEKKSSVIFVTSRYRVRFALVKTVMSLYRLGKLRLEDLTRLSHRYAWYLGDLKVETDISAGIANGSLLLHIKTKMRLPRSSDVQEVRPYVPRICPHIIGLYQSCSWEWKALCETCDAGNVPCHKCSRRAICLKCGTWYQLRGKNGESPWRTLRLISGRTLDRARVLWIHRGLAKSVG